MLGNLHVRFGVGVGVKLPGLHHVRLKYLGRFHKEDAQETLLTMLQDRSRLVGCVARDYVDEACDSSARQLSRQCEALATLCSLGSLASQSLRKTTKGTG